MTRDRRMLFELLMAVSIPALASCARPAETHAVADGSARSAILSTSREFSARYVRGDIEGMVALYAPGGVILPPNRPIIRGAQALRDYWTLSPGLRVLEHRATPDSLMVVDDTAYDWGTYTVRTSSNGTERTTNGKYLIVWIRTAPSTWRMLADMWNAGS